MDRKRNAPSLEQLVCELVLDPPAAPLTRSTLDGTILKGASLSLHPPLPHQKAVVTIYESKIVDRSFQN